MPSYKKVRKGKNELHCLLVMLEERENSIKKLKNSKGTVMHNEKALINDRLRV